jgi:hypothetical protein
MAPAEPQAHTGDQPTQIGVSAVSMPSAFGQAHNALYPGGQRLDWRRPQRIDDARPCGGEVAKWRCHFGDKSFASLR